MEDYLKIVTVGEVDAGKSTLMGRFLYEMGSVSKETVEDIENTCQRLKSNFEFAYLLDSFEEERRNQLTIDTTQTFCRTKRGKEFVFIDVPGHQELIKNMLCGSSYADIAILVIDVQKSIEEQTKRHAFILKFLGIEQIIMVLNKMDLVGFKESIFQVVKEDAIELLKKLQLQPIHFIPISAKQGDNLLRISKNMPWYKGLTLNRVLNARFNKIEANSDFCFPIQDIYNLNGEKVAVGEIISGKIKMAEKVNILPLNKVSTVKKIKVFNQNKRIASVPESIGLVLDDMDELRRGQIICKPRLPEVKMEISAKIFCVHPLNIKESLEFRCSTQETPSRISQIMGVWDTASLEPKSNGNILDKNDLAEVVIATKDPIVIDRFKGSKGLARFVLKNSQDIYAVGIVP